MEKMLLSNNVLSKTHNSRTLQLEQLELWIAEAKTNGATEVCLYESLDCNGDFEDFDITFQCHRIETDEEFANRKKNTWKNKLNEYENQINRLEKMLEQEKRSRFSREEMLSMQLAEAREKLEKTMKNLKEME
jgi:hypothetical protein